MVSKQTTVLAGVNIAVKYLTEIHDLKSIPETPPTLEAASKWLLQNVTGPWGRTGASEGLAGAARLQLRHLTLALI